MQQETLRLKDGTSLVLRRACNEDRRAVTELIFEVLEDYGMKGEIDGTDACVQDIERNYLAGGGIFHLVVDHQAKLLGCYGLLPHGEGICELRKMYLRAEVRGRGLGKLLMERALSEARSLGFRRIELDTAAPLKEAIEMYKRYGFKEFDKPGIPARCDRAMALDL